MSEVDVYPGNIIMMTTWFFLCVCGVGGEEGGMLMVAVLDCEA